MKDWFDVIYCYKKRFQNLDELNNDIKVANELNTNAGNMKRGEDKRIDILKNYLTSIHAIDKNGFKEMGNAIVSAGNLNKKYIDGIYAQLAKLKPFDVNKYDIYASTIGAIRQHGDKFFSNQGVSMNDGDPVDPDVVDSIAKQFEELKAQQDDEHNLVSLVKLYYSIVSDKDKVTEITYGAVTKSTKKAGIYNDIYSLPFILIAITDLSYYSNALLMQLYLTIMQTDHWTDVEFVDALVKYNNNNLNIDANNLKALITEINKVYPDSRICSTVDKNLLNATLFGNGPAAPIKKEMIAAGYNKCSTKLFMEFLVRYMTGKQEGSESKVINEKNRDTQIQLLNEQLNVFMTEYADLLTGLKNGIDEYNKKLSDIVPLKLDGGKGKLDRYNLKECILRWNSFIKSRIYTTDEKLFNDSFNVVAKDLYNFYNQKRTVEINGTDVKIINDKLETDVKAVASLISIFAVNMDKLIELYGELIDNSFVINAAGMFKKNATPDIQNKVVNLLLDYLRDFITKGGSGFNTQITFKRNNMANSNDGYYHAACNLIYRKDYNVT